MNNYRYLHLAIWLLLLSACTSQSVKEISGKAIANTANTEVGYSTQQCFVVKQQCVQGYYEEWFTSDGTPGCSCAK